MMKAKKKQKSKNLRKRKTFWQKEEDNFLLDRVEDQKELNWTVIADKLNKAIGSDKTGKQCRERYRNYVKPSLNNEKIDIKEKLLFLYLHNIFKNQWKKITYFLNHRSDISLKNCFYCIARNAIRILRNKEFPQSYFSDELENFYVTYCALDLIRTDYLPALKICSKKRNEMPKNEHKEKIILDLLKYKKFTNESILQFQANAILKLKEFHDESLFPLILKVDLKAIGITEERIKEFLEKYKESNTFPALDQCVKISFESQDIRAEEEQKNLMTPRALFTSYRPVFNPHTLSLPLRYYPRISNPFMPMSFYPPQNFFSYPGQIIRTPAYIPLPRINQIMHARTSRENRELHSDP